MKEIILKYPPTIDGSKISSITLRRPNGEDMIEIGDDFATLEAAERTGPNRAVFSAMVHVVKVLADFPEAGKLDAADLTRAVKELGSLVGESPEGGEAKTGETP